MSPVSGKSTPADLIFMATLNVKNVNLQHQQVKSAYGECAVFAEEKVSQSSKKSDKITEFRRTNA